MRRLLTALLLWSGGLMAQEQAEGSSLWAQFLELLRRPLFTVGETAVNSLGITRALVILLVTMVLSSALRSAVERFQQRDPSVGTSTLQSVSFILHYLLILIGVILAIVSLGFNLSSLALIAGALGVGVGFGLQAIISNFISGIIIFFEKSLKVGDYIELESGVTGVVREIRVRSTLITTNDNIDILVPNSEFVSGRVINWTLREASRRLRVPFGVAYGTDKEVVKKAVLEAARDVPFTLPDAGARKAQVWLTGFGDSALEFELVIWINRSAIFMPQAVIAAYNWAIHTALKTYEIEIPFPQRDLHLKSTPESSAGEGNLSDRHLEQILQRLSPTERQRLGSNDAAEEVVQQVQSENPADPDPDAKTGEKQLPAPDAEQSAPPPESSRAARRARRKKEKPRPAPRPSQSVQDD